MGAGAGFEPAYSIELHYDNVASANRLNLLGDSLIRQTFRGKAMNFILSIFSLSLGNPFRGHPTC